MFSNSFPDREVMAELTAKMLMEIKAVNFRPEEPYILASGLASPVYIDCRKLISYPRIRGTLMEFAVATLLRDAGFEKFDAIAGGETAGIPFAAWIADKMALPMQYVRKKPKGYGRDAQIEGDIHEGQNVLLVEDLTTDGGSKIKFCEALRTAGAEVTDTLVVFYYDIFPETKGKLAEHGVNLHYLATWHDILRVCRSNDYFSPEKLNEVEKFLNNPLEWSAANGGVSELPL
ncbi:orotate phosphoribosyltransferase [Pseudovibrio denitrificans]|uniref:Orotate phosphoribosyltransferase n=1 Tax=Pseudovibrio denitrificans TaxID=258256 RepID=A0A1I7BBT3_9HYPH|nr:MULTISPECIES: orotate phosphoribosyltransferase [Pseudovibrio]EEA95370.1 orotate phosphoribosyltransferase [Pseudovibrio sp. JE062]SFT84608.1 orotate phosphoribosyltransferase [Pseudovibrio denitrificans]